MALVKLKTSNEWKAGQKNLLPFVGEVKFDENAQIEVDSSIVEKLIEYSNEFSLVEEGEDIKKKSEDSEELGKSDGPDINPQTEESEVLRQVEENQPVSEKSKEEIIREKLAELSVKEIKGQYLSQFPVELVKGLKNREQYIEFLVSQLLK